MRALALSTFGFAHAWGSESIVRDPVLLVTSCTIPARVRGREMIVSNLSLSIPTGASGGVGPYAAAEGAVPDLTYTRVAYRETVVATWGSLAPSDGLGPRLRAEAGCRTRRDANGSFRDAEL